MVNYIIIGIVICGILLIAIAVWFILRWLKKRKQKKLLLDVKTGIPLETLKDFEELEKRIKESNGNISPYQIIWEYAKERNTNQNKTGGVKQNVNTYRQGTPKEDREPGSSSYYPTNTTDATGTTSAASAATTQPSSGTTGTIADSKSADGNLQRDRELVETRNIPLQLGVSSPEEQRDTKGTKRNIKVDWQNFD